AFFDCWDSGRHVIRPFEVPKEWMRFRSMDWGSASPFSVGWWAIVQDDFETDGRVLPRGCMVRYREWYGMKSGQPNVGVKINAEQVGMSIAAREKDDKISYGVLDPSAFEPRRSLARAPCGCSPLLLCLGGVFTPRRRQLAEVTRNKQRGSAPSGLNADKRMRVRWRQSWGDVFDLLLKDRDLLLLLIIAVLGALIGIAALFGVLIYALR